jgi:CheY-like chemotaxis protein
MTHEDDFPATQPVSSGHVLVVDDIEVNRILARAYLEMIGWTVHEADSGLRAMQFLAEKVPQAVLIDIRMPGISGDELVRHIRKKLGAGIRLVGYTAHCMPDEIRQFMDAGFDQVLIKPVSLADMTSALPLPDSYPLR